MRRGHERGTITLWLLGCCVMLFAVGGISVDLWRSFSARRALAAAADAAALRGASAIDEDRYRSSAAVELVPGLAEARARASLRGQLDAAAMRSVEISADVRSVTVTVRGVVGLTLLRLVADRELEVAVAATASPRRPS
ncbi:MAG: pilus assembly protein TadG-related protein [Acidimicrobiia bacterium]